jgi:hypothetical protein
MGAGAVVTVTPTGTYSGGNLCFPADTSGHYSLQVVATTDCGSDTCVVEVDVTINSNPVAVDPTTPVDTFICAAGDICHQFTANDIDGGTLSWTRLSGNGTITSQGQWCFTASSSGSYTITAVVADACGAKDTTTLTYNVTKNSPPVAALGNDTSIFLCEGDSYCFGYSATDPDDNISLEELVGGAGTIDTLNDEVCFTPATGGQYSFILQVTDICGAIDQDTINITIQLGTEVAVTCPADTAVFLCVPQQVCRPVGVSVTGATVSVSPIGTYSGGQVCFDADTAGHYVLTVIAGTSCGADTCDFAVDVDLNSAPVATEPPPVDTFICDPDDVYCQLHAHDSEGGQLTWNRQSGNGTVTPGGLWSFAASATGSYSVTAVVADECGAKDTVNVTYNITVNSPPAIAFAKPDPLTFQCGSEEVCFGYVATDPDDNIELEELVSSFGIIDTLANEVCFTPDTAGTYGFIVQVSDSCGAVAVDTLLMTIEFNQSPVADAGVDQSLFRCNTAPVCWAAGCDDPDGNLDTCYLTTSVGSYNGSQICFTPDTAGHYTFILRAEDECAESDEDTVTVDITFNSPPVCVLPDDSTFFQCSPTEVSLPVSATDADDNFDHCEIITGPGSVIGGEWTYTPSGDQTVKVVVMCIDECGASCVDSFNATFEINSAPVVDLGEDAQFFRCGSGTICLDADVSDEDGNLMTVEVLSSVGTYNDGTGEVCFNVNYGSDRYYSIIMKATDSCGAADYDTVQVYVDFNSAPSVETPPDFVAYLDEVGELCFDVIVEDDDNNVTDVTVSPLGQYSSSTGQVCFDADTTGRYCLTITAEDACGLTATDSICIDVQIDECIHVQIEKVHNALQGHIETVNIYLNGSGKELGGFDFLIAYDAGAITPIAVAPGALFEACGWEYFTYRFNANGNCTGGCPSGLLRIVGMAETNNGAYHPGCFFDGMVGIMASIDFLTSNDRTLECQFVPVSFFWLQCTDNTFSSKGGDTMWVSRSVYDFEFNSIQDYTYGFPGYFGAPNECLEGEGPGKPKPIRCIDFTNGGIDLICADSIDLRGDINMNGFGYEIADAVMFTNYFIYGLAAFGAGMQIEGAIAASDVNADGIPLSVSDLVYLIRVIIGDTSPVPKASPHEKPESEFRVSGSVLEILDCGTHIGAIHLVLEGEAHPTLHEDIAGAEMQYRFDGTDTRVLIYSRDASAQLGEGPILDLNGSTRVKTIEASSFDGYVVAVRINSLPEDYSLSQNYPNPFNPVTTIEFALPVPGKWKLVIYNILGQVVQSWEREDEAGYYKVEWDAGRYASGVYFYRFKAGDFSATKKMVLIK